MVFAISRIREEKKLPPDPYGLHPAVSYVVAGGVPIAVMVTMTYLFYIVGGSPTVQFNAGSSSAMDVWSAWVKLFPLFLLLSAANSLGSLIWMVVAVAKKNKRSHLKAAVLTFLLSLLTLFTVGSHFPSA